MLGQQIGGYRVVEKLGEGGMGVVYIAEHPHLSKAVVKVLHRHLTGDAEISRRFINEATAASKIDHPGIVRIMDVGTHEPTGQLFILMELLDGESLADRLKRERRLAPDRAIVLTGHMVSVLASAHAIGIVHRDLKPDNLFIVPDPQIAGGERLKVLDFGIAKLGEAGGTFRTKSGAMMGTPVYMSPEQCRGAGRVDSRSDFYSLGCILFEMLCGHPPFVGEGVGDLISAHMNEPPPRLREVQADLPAPLESIVSRLLEKDPDRRYQTADELRAALDAAASWSSASDATARAHAADPRTPAPVYAGYSNASTGPTQTTHAGAAGQQAPRTTPAVGPRRWFWPLAVASVLAGAVALIAILASGDKTAVTASSASTDGGLEETEDASRIDAASQAVPANTDPAALEKLEEARRLLAGDQLTEARVAIGAAKSLDPDHPEILAVHDEIEERVAEAGALDARWTRFTAAVKRADRPADARRVREMASSFADTTYAEQVDSKVSEAKQRHRETLLARARRADGCDERDRIAASAVWPDLRDDLKRIKCKSSARRGAPAETEATPSDSDSQEEHEAAIRAGLDGSGSISAAYAACLKVRGSRWVKRCVVMACRNQNRARAQAFFRRLPEANRRGLMNLCLSQGIVLRP